MLWEEFYQIPVVSPHTVSVIRKWRAWYYVILETKFDEGNVIILYVTGKRRKPGPSPKQCFMFPPWKQNCYTSGGPQLIMWCPHLNNLETPDEYLGAPTYYWLVASNYENSFYMSLQSHRNTVSNSVLHEIHSRQMFKPCPNTARPGWIVPLFDTMDICRVKLIYRGIYILVKKIFWR